MDPEVRLFVQCTEQRDAMGEPLVEPGLKRSLHVVLTDVPPRLDRLPHERQDDAPRVSVVQPHLFRQERDVVEADHLGFTQRPDLVVDGQKGLDVFGIDLEDQDLDRQAFTRVVAKVGGHVVDRSFRAVRGRAPGRRLAADIERGKARSNEC